MDVPAAVVKTLVMMAGEIEYENFIYENGEALYPFTGHTMILIFTVLVSHTYQPLKTYGHLHSNNVCHIST